MPSGRAGGVEAGSGEVDLHPRRHDLNREATRERLQIGSVDRQQAPDDQLELAASQVERLDVDALAHRVHAGAVCDPDRKRGDPERERRVRIRRAGVEQRRKAELLPHAEDGPEKLGLAREATGMTPRDRLE